MLWLLGVAVVAVAAAFAAGFALGSRPVAQLTARLERQWELIDDLKARCRVEVGR